MNTALITATASVLTVGIGFVLTHWSAARNNRHLDQLTRVQSQLSRLYGPMYAMTQSNGIAYRAMRGRYDPEGLFDKRTSESVARIDAHQREIYRLWMTTVLQPTSRKVCDLLLAYADLLLDETMPECAMVYFTHVRGYEVVLAQWESGDYDELFSLVQYPQAFTDYVANSFMKLQAQQAQLLAN
ncbi:hypothetical protein GFY24_12950 [Nocardia sp. SYP-A9097]|uniref:hypothetical protein n=1 Tax=Nocardia sp. SYP-A9097 TaxID=2663237 RepID=UPI00129B99E5|nr:hypothetical protein [Nocardia sp. SYP-A9097]MRH88342.1 hypothetical protein [Nocardia sp. SYP-A9097]